MNYVLAVKSPVYGKQGAFLAYQFAQALLEKGHAISQIFFFQEGVSNGNGLVYPANDEFNLTQAWQAFSAQHHIPLHLCVAASQRRGVVDSLTAKETDKTNLAEGFKTAGLGEFMAMALKADRVVTLFRTAPHGNAISREGLDALLAATAFCDEEEIGVFFIDDGVLNLLDGQHPELLLQKDFIRTFKLLDLYDIEQRFVCANSLDQYNLQAEQLIISAEKIDRTSLINKLSQAEKVFTF